MTEITLRMDEDIFAALRRSPDRWVPAQRKLTTSDVLARAGQLLDAMHR